MNYKLVVRISTDSYEEEQFILTRFPEAYWTPNVRREGTTFYLPADRESDVQKVINEYKELKKK